jgi:hypothetical protein
MVKSILFIFLLITLTPAQDLFEKHCIPCHKAFPITLQEMFKNYLLVYSGEANVKAGIKHYLQYPLSDISVMSKLFKETYGIKDKTTLSPEELDKIIDIYWERYKVFGKLK